MLFSKEIVQAHPNCRVRFTRYDGTTAGVGSKLNIIKDVNLDLPILKLIPQAKSTLSTQLKDVTKLNPATGRFETMPEYPEFAWTEALVNAIAHREYALEGAYIQVNMFDNRLEIISPGKLPNIVTIDNIQHTRYSRNPHISRVLVDFGWVRELNEGVRRIFADMKASALSEPTYSEPDQRYVQIILHNGYENQKAEAQHIHDLTTHLLQREDLDTLERDIMLHLTKISRLKLREIMQLTGKSRNTVSKRIKNLLSKGLINTVGDINSPTRYYCAKPTIEQVTRQN